MGILNILLTDMAVLLFQKSVRAVYTHTHTHTHTHIQLADSATTAVWDGKLKIEQGVQ